MSAEFFQQFTQFNSSLFKPLVQAGTIAQEHCKATLTHASGATFDQMNTNLEHLNSLASCQKTEEVVALAQKSQAQTLATTTKLTKSLVDTYFDTVQQWASLFPAPTAVAKTK